MLTLLISIGISGIILYVGYRKAVKADKKRVEAEIIKIVRNTKSTMAENWAELADDHFQSAKDSWQELSKFYTIDLGDKEQVAIILKNFDNILQFTSSVLECPDDGSGAEKSRVEKILSENGIKIILRCLRLKRTFRELYQKIGRVALRHGAKIVVGPDLERFLTYADGKKIKFNKYE